jgi:hypothetical protein
VIKLVYLVGLAIGFAACFRFVFRSRGDLEATVARAFSFSDFRPVARLRFWLCAASVVSGAITWGAKTFVL